MDKFINESQLKGFRRSTKVFSDYKSLNESLSDFKNESKLYKKKIFLSHKHDEFENLEGAISFLKSFGVDIYVDWLDEGMPKYTSGATANRIKQKIRENDKFIFLGSEGAINSKWCNWELGLGDADKYIENIAILPIEKDNSLFSGSEYLSIYPYVKYEDGNSYYKNGTKISEGYYVFTSTDNGLDLVSLDTWLRR